MKRIVLASGNPGKVREIGALLLPLSITVVPQQVLRIAEADEPHATFLENALAKARHASRTARLPALADDSGLCVDALRGAPGVHSAYYAGHEGNREERDRRNNERLLANLSNERLLASHSNERRAYYYCVMVMVRTPDDPRPLVADGLWHGEIAQAARGSNGFGYDPLFFIPELNQTAAELDPEHKNRISHRGIALAKLIELLRDPGRG